MVEDPAQLDEIFVTALSHHDAAVRSAYLDQACAGDSLLKARVEALLAAHDATGNFLKLSDSDGKTAELLPSSEGPGAAIGPYKLLQQIGEGGMGTVFMAEQTRPVQRTVALKIIKPGMDTRQVIARFEAERQALAMMDHPNIAKVLDAGTTDSGRPYFVMELVKGLPITKYCDDHQLSLRERLSLFLPVCQAVQHAHQKGIIHRDLKPSNVMIASYDGRPVPKIIDFGVSKATGPKLTDRTLFTEFGTILGTLEYMSPEQAELNQLDVDTRSDIYSLGVLLYELLTGTTPLERGRMKSTALHEVLRLIREEDPPRPSTRLSSSNTLPSIAASRGLEPAKLSGLVRGELDWIVMKALEKDRNRRYETANSFAADVQRYLNDEPVHVCPPSATYRLQKYFRRNKLTVIAGSAILLALILGMFGTTLGLIRAERARRAEAEQRQLAEANEKKAVAAAAAETAAKKTAESRAAETQAVLDFVENKIFAAARPEGEEGGLGHDVTLRRAMEAALPFVETSFTSQPLIEARLRMTLGTSFRLLGDEELSAQLYQKAHTLFEQNLGPYDPLTLWSMNNVAASYNSLGRFADAIKLQEKTLAQKKAELGPDHPHTLASMGNLANSYFALGRYDETLKLQEEMLAAHQKKFGDDHADTLKSMGNLANTYFALGRRDEAVQLLEESLELRKTRFGADHPDTLSNMTSLAGYYNGLRRPAEALKLLEETLALQKVKLGHDHPDTLRSMSNLANSYYGLGRRDEAIELYEEALTLKKAKLGPAHPDTLLAMSALAACYQEIGRRAESLELQVESLTLRKTKLGPDHPATLATMVNLAKCYHELGRYADARGVLEETLSLQKAKLGLDHPDTLASMHNLGAILAGLGQDEDASRLFDEVLPLEKSKLGPDHPQTLTTMSSLASCYSQLGRHTDAVRILEELLALRKAKLGPNHPETAATMELLAAVRYGQGRYSKTLQLQEEKLALQKAKLGPDHRDTLKSMFLVACGYTAVGRSADAIKLHEETLALQSAKLGPDDPDTLLNMNELAWALATCADPAERDPGRAVDLAKSVVAVAPEEGQFWNTLGVARYRVGDWKAAITALETSSSLRNHGNCNDLLFLAMAHWQLGDTVKAAEYRERADKWLESNPLSNEELPRFQAEAAKLLGIKRSHPVRGLQPTADAARSTSNLAPVELPTKR